MRVSLLALICCVVQPALCFGASLRQNPAPPPQDQAAQDAVMIKRVLAPKEETKYSVEGSLNQTVTMPGGMEQSVTTAVSAKLILKACDALEDGKLPFTLTVEKLSLLSTPEQPGDSKDRTVTLKGMVDEQNVMSDLSLEGVRKRDLSIAGLVARMAQGIGTYPDKPVKVGDTWTVAEQESFLGDTKLEYSLRFDGQQTVGGLTLYTLSTNTDVPVVVDLGTMERGSPGMAMKGMVHVVAQAYVDQNGLINSMTFETKAEMAIDSPDAGGQIKLNSDEILKIVRQPSD